MDGVDTIHTLCWRPWRVVTSKLKIKFTIMWSSACTGKWRETSNGTPRKRALIVRERAISIQPIVSYHVTSVAFWLLKCSVSNPLPSTYTMVTPTEIRDTTSVAIGVRNLPVSISSMRSCTIKNP